MAGAHSRIILPSGLWILLYEDGDMKLSGYDHHLEIVEVLNRRGDNPGTHVHFKVRPLKENPRMPTRRSSDILIAYS